MFADALVVRASFSADPRFTELLAQVRLSFMGALTHQLPVQQLMENLGENGHKGSQVLSQVFFDSLPDIPVNIQLKDLKSATYFPTDRERMRHDLELYIRPVPKGMYCALWCSRTLFDPSIARRMVDDFTMLLERIADNPDERISGLLQGIPSRLVHEVKF
jgi:non-ribosomal peptide synthetase component F